MKSRILLVPMLILLAVPTGVWAQMDMLPFLFRDLPKEFEAGVPARMTFDEFRQLNRKIDFFTVGMSMIWPGYASAQVERQDQSLLLGGLRWGTFGMMGTAVWRQWDSLENVWKTQDLGPLQYDQVKGNMALFVAGGMLNMGLWAADVLLAYHQAMEDRDRVIYRYGLARTVSNEELPEDELLRRLAVQDDPKIRSMIIQELTRKLVTWDKSTSYGEFSWYLGYQLYRASDRARALAVLMRGMNLDPLSPWQFRSESLAMTILKESRDPWKTDIELLTPPRLGTEPMDSIGYLRVLPLVEAKDLRTALLELADQYLQQPGRPEQGDQVLALMAAAWAKEGAPELQAIALRKISLYYPENGKGN